jgi:cytochrome c oxidase subunit 4
MTTEVKMEHASPEAIKKHVRVYIAVFAALAALTIVTVSVSYLHLPFEKAVVVALFIASIKAALVALFFMHLISERMVIFSILAITFFFFLHLLILPVLSS